jgi:hypothetical protein
MAGDRQELGSSFRGQKPYLCRHRNTLGCKDHSLISWKQPDTFAKLRDAFDGLCWAFEPMRERQPFGVFGRFCMWRDFDRKKDVMFHRSAPQSLPFVFLSLAS